MHLAYKLGLCALREQMLKDRLDYISGASAETNAKGPALQLSQAFKISWQACAIQRPAGPAISVRSECLSPSTSLRAVP